MILALSFNAYAQKNESAEKIVTTKWSFISGAASIADHYFTNQEFTTDGIIGASVEFGSFYKKNQNLSWNLDLSYVGAGATSANAPSIITQLIKAFGLNVNFSRLTSSAIGVISFST